MKKMKPLRTYAYMVVSGDRRTVYTNVGMTPRKAIRAFMKEWGANTDNGIGSKWRYWYRAGYRPVRVEIREIKR
jgi:hypothetical protein